MNCVKAMPFSFGFSFTYFFLQATAQEVRQAELTVGGSVRLLPAEELDLPDNPPYLRREMLSRVHPHRPDGRSSWLESSPEEEAQKAEEATQNATTVTRPFTANVSVSNVTLLEGPAGRPGLVVAGMYGPAGPEGMRGATGPAGPVGPTGPAGASVIGKPGSQGMPGPAGKMGKTGKTGAQGHAGVQGSPGRPPEDFYKWSKLLAYYTQVVSKMQEAAGKHVRGFNREVSMLQQQSAIYQARSFALNNGSVDLHRYMVENYKRMVKSASSAEEVDQYLARMSMATPMDALHEAQRLYPAYVGTQRVASAMQAVQYGNAQGAYGSQGNRGRSSKSTAAMLSGSWLLLLTPVLAWW
ncbi:Collagen alpha-1(XVII) chain (180 kDa bullous pemphigoid antigen 2) (Bullous pemphigoid antigen 2) [Cleaved into: 120 kDa linear IgA disease antigen homolog] [Durusdinium trenchii]